MESLEKTNASKHTQSRGNLRDRNWYQCSWNWIGKLAHALVHTFMV